MIRFTDQPLPECFLASLVRRYELHRDVQRSTVAQKRATINCFERFLKRSAQLADLERETIVGFLAWYRERAEPGTVATKRRDLLTLWEFAYEERLVSQSPQRIRAVRQPQKVPDGWDLTELRQLLAATERLPGTYRYLGDRRQRVDVPKGLVLRALVRGFLCTGLRRNALLKVLKSELRPDGVFAARWQNAKTWAEQTKKLDAEAVAAVQAVHAYGEFRTLFPAPSKKYLNADWRKLLELAGLRSKGNVLAQHLRRTASSYVEQQRPGTARHFLGHKTPGLAERRYLVPRIVRPELIEGPRLDL
jgi:hypothetical protein